MFTIRILRKRSTTMISQFKFSKQLIFMVNNTWYFYWLHLCPYYMVAHTCVKLWVYFTLLTGRVELLICMFLMRRGNNANTFTHTHTIAPSTVLPTTCLPRSHPLFSYPRVGKNVINLCPTVRCFCDNIKTPYPFYELFYKD